MTLAFPLQVGMSVGVAVLMFDFDRTPTIIFAAKPIAQIIGAQKGCQIQRNSGSPHVERRIVRLFGFRGLPAFTTYHKARTKPSDAQQRDAGRFGDCGRKCYGAQVGTRRSIENSSVEVLSR